MHNKLAVVILQALVWHTRNKMSTGRSMIRPKSYSKGIENENDVRTRIYNIIHRYYVYDAGNLAVSFL